MIMPIIINPALPALNVANAARITKHCSDGHCGDVPVAAVILIPILFALLLLLAWNIVELIRR